MITIIFVLIAACIIGEIANLYPTRQNKVTLVLFEIRFHLIWFLYFLCTQNARANYRQGEWRGYHVKNSYSEAKWYGADYIFQYDYSTKPFREYSTYKELRQAWRKAGKL